MRPNDGTKNTILQRTRRERRGEGEAVDGAAGGAAGGGEARVIVDAATTPVLRSGGGKMGQRGGIASVVYLIM